MHTCCYWMNLELSSPFILASITPFSNLRAHEQALFLKKAVDYGAGAIVLPSVNPETAYYNEVEQSIHKVETRINQVKTGLIDGKNSPFAFSLLGNTSNIAPFEYVKMLYSNLCKELKMSSNKVPIIASIANLGNSEQFVTALKRIVELDGISGIELNFSCPNVITSSYDSNEPNTKGLVGLRLLTTDILKQVSQICNQLPTSIKLPPNINYHELLSKTCTYFDGLTLSNAYIGLEPPIVDMETSTYKSAFPSYTKWAPTGIYGPFERLLTYKDLYSAISVLTKNKQYNEIAVSCVGGIVTAEQAIAAIMLGASTVQLSSAIAWNGLRSFESFNSYLKKFMSKNNIDNIEKFRGIALSSICESADTAVDFRKDSRIAIIDEAKCLKCKSCACCERFCLAISQNDGKLPQIDNTLCNGCGWCKDACINAAITYYYSKQN